MSDTEATRVMTPAEARRRFALYFGIRLMGVACLILGVFLLARDAVAMGALLTLAGAFSLFIRPKNLGLTRPPRS
jgi:uncharacterized membrane protein HdeD (DUF308 family)